MADLRQMMARHASTTLVRLDQFGEEVTYRPLAGAERKIQVVVNRRDLEPLAPGVPRVARLQAIVWIPRDPTIGVPTLAVGDVLVLALRLGAAEIAARVKRVLAEDEAAYEVEVAG